MFSQNQLKERMVNEKDNLPNHTLQTSTSFNRCTVIVGNTSYEQTVAANKSECMWRWVKNGKNEPERNETRAEDDVGTA